MDARGDAAVRGQPRAGTPGSACATSRWTTSSRPACASRCRCWSLLVLVGYAGWAVQILWRLMSAATPGTRRFDASSSAPAARACAPRCSSRAPASRSRCCPRCSRRARTPWRRRAASPRSLGNIERGQLALAHVRHRQGLATGSATRTRSSSCAARRPRSCYELEHFGMPFDRTRRRQDLPAPVRRPHAELRREAGAARLRRGRPHRPRDAAHAVPAERAGANTQFFVEWMALDLIRDADGDVLGVMALEMETGEVIAPAGEGHAVRHRRRRAHLRGQHQRLHQHRRRPGHGGARRHSAARTWSSGSSIPTGVPAPAC